MRIALVHDWLTGYRGGERVLHHLAKRFPDADLFTLFHTPGSVTPVIENRRIVTSFLDRIPGKSTHYR
ncbi:MAG: glycosyl transferase, group 1 family protein, partial [Myxococcota bacterium]